MTLTVTLNPSVDRLIFVAQLVAHDTNRVQKVEEDVGGKGVNVARVLKRLEASPFLIKPNETEAERLLGRAIDTLDDAARAALELHNRGISIVIVSIGGKGAAVACADGCWVAIPPKVKAISTVGSGDSMIAGFLSVLYRQGALDEAIRWDTSAGAATAMTDGSDIGTAEQIHALLPRVEVRKW